MKSKWLVIQTFLSLMAKHSQCIKLFINQILPESNVGTAFGSFGRVMLFGPGRRDFGPGFGRFDLIGFLTGSVLVCGFGSVGLASPKSSSSRKLAAKSASLLIIVGSGSASVLVSSLTVASESCTFWPKNFNSLSLISRSQRRI